MSWAQHTDNKINKAMQQQWIENTIVELKKSDAFSSFKPIKADIKSFPEYSLVSYRIYGKVRLQCADGEWIYFKSNSSHTNSEVGDVCLAISDKGKVYVNYGHICGGIVHFNDKSNQTPRDANDFFTRFNSDIDNQPWVIWK